MHIEHVVKAVNEIEDSEVLIVNYTSGKTTIVKPNDKISEVKYGNVVISRALPASKRNLVYIDCMKIESMILKSGEFYDG